VAGRELIESSKDSKYDFASRPQDTSDSCGFFASANGVSFRPMTVADLDEVMAIERASFAYPWSSRFFLQEFQVQCARSVLAVVDGKIAGYVLFWLLSYEVDIHNLAVRSEFRRRGIGKLLLREVVNEALRQCSLRVTLEVRKSNMPAQRLYQSVGFVATGVRRGYYSDNGEDAVVMTLKLAHQ